MMLTPVEYAFPDAETADTLGLPPGREYGLLFCVDEDGKHWTVAGDASYARMLADAPDEARLELPRDAFQLQMPGWPDDPN